MTRMNQMTRQLDSRMTQIPKVFLGANAVGRLCQAPSLGGSACPQADGGYDQRVGDNAFHLAIYRPTAGRFPASPTGSCASTVLSAAVRS